MRFTCVKTSRVPSNETETSVKMGTSSFNHDRIFYAERRMEHGPDTANIREDPEEERWGCATLDVVDEDQGGRNPREKGMEMRERRRTDGGFEKVFQPRQRSWRRRRTPFRVAP